jgi:hypothetical protein
MEDKFWVENPSILIKNFNQFIPNRQMTILQQMNSITLFCIYAILILHLVGLLNNIVAMFFIGIIVILVILYFNKYNKVNQSDYDEKFQVESGYYDSDNNLKIGKFYSEKNRNKELDKMVFETSMKNQKILEKKREPTVDNPFMNPILNDFNTDNVPYPVNTDDDVVKQKINLTYNKDLFKDLNDLYDSKNVERQFFTIPGGAIPNDQQKFAEWCYKTPYTCKEDSKECNIFDDIRYRNNYK